MGYYGGHRTRRRRMSDLYERRAPDRRSGRSGRVVRGSTKADYEDLEELLE